MIAYIEGKILEKQLDRCVIVTGGVGYQVFMPLRMLGKYAVNDNICAYIFHRVSETSSDLFGFENPADKIFFQTLLSVSGVGPKTAVAIMEFPPQKIREAIESEDIAFITQVPGLGKKTASRLILEIKGKLPEVEGPSGVSTAKYTDVIAVLESLGFENAKISTLLQNIPDTVANLPEEKIVKWGLKNL